MANPSPLAPVHREGEGLDAPYGPPDQPVQLIQAFDPVEVEYAAIRRHAAVFDAAHRGTLVFTGADRLALLNRMLTQDLRNFEPFTARRAFLLSRKGRIDADLRLINLPDRLLADADIFAAERTGAALEKFIITEDVTIADVTAAWHVLSLHGPAAAAIIARVSEPVAGASAADIAPGQVSVVRIAGAEVVIDRRDWAGEIGLELRVPAEHVAAVYHAISTPWSARGHPGALAPTSDLARRIGWHALNIARIEAGTALYYLDFGPDTLPHECGDAMLHDRVSFTKGCYLGQEIVARMQARGHPKQKLVALRIEQAADAPEQAVTGSPVVDADAPTAATVGAVTSSCLAPMLGQAPIALAMVRYAQATPGTRLWIQLDGSRPAAVVQENLRQIPR